MLGGNLFIPTPKTNEETVSLSAERALGGHSKVHLFTPEIPKGGVREGEAFPTRS